MSDVLDLKKKNVKHTKEVAEISEQQHVATEQKLPSSGENIALDQPRFVFLPDHMEWTGPEFYRSGSRRGSYYFGFFLVLVAIAAQIFLHNPITTILFLAVASIVLLQSHKNPALVEFEINENFIRAGQRIYKYDQIESFFIEFLPEFGVNQLSLQLTKWYYPYIKIPLQSQDPVQVNDFLIEFILEKEHEDTVVDTFSKRMGL